MLSRLKALSMYLQCRLYGKHVRRFNSKAQISWSLVILLEGARNHKNQSQNHNRWEACSKFYYYFANHWTRWTFYLTVLFTLRIWFCAILWGLSKRKKSYYFLNICIWTIFRIPGNARTLNSSSCFSCLLVALAVLQPIDGCNRKFPRTFLTNLMASSDSDLVTSQKSVSLFFFFNLQSCCLSTTMSFHVITHVQITCTCMRKWHSSNRLTAHYCLK